MYSPLNILAAYKVLKYWKILLGQSRSITWAVLLLALTGGYQFTRLPVTYLPEISPKQVQVIFNHSASEPMSLKREANLLINHLQTLTGISYVHYSIDEKKLVIKLDLEKGYYKPDLIPEIRARIDGVASQLKERLGLPFITLNGSATPVMKLAIQGELPVEVLSEITTSIILPRLKQVNGMALTDVSGLAREQPVLYANSTRVARWSSRASLAGSTNSSQTTVFAGNVRAGQKIYPVVAEGQVAEDNWSAYRIPAHGKRLLTLTEIGLVGRTVIQDDGIHHVNGNRSIVIRLYSGTATRLTEFRISLGQLFKEIESKYPEISIKVLEDRTREVATSLSGLWWSLFTAVAGVFLIQLMFTSDIRIPLLAGMVIPLSMMISAGIMSIAGMSMNIISLSGLILGTGILIDNGIVISEGIIRSHHKGMSLPAATWYGLTEMAGPIVGSNITTMVIFLPMIYGQGIISIIFGEEARIIIINVICSVFISVLVLPVLYTRLFSIRLPGRDSSSFIRMQKMVLRPLNKIRSHPLLVIAAFLVFSTLSLVVIKWLPKSMVPNYSGQSWRLEIDTVHELSKEMPDGYHDLIIEKTTGSTGYILEESFSGTGFNVYGPESYEVIQEISQRYNGARILLGEDPVSSLLDANEPASVLKFTGEESVLNEFMTRIGKRGRMKLHQATLLNREAEMLIGPISNSSVPLIPGETSGLSIRYSGNDSLINRTNQSPVRARDVAHRYTRFINSEVTGDMKGDVARIAYRAQADKALMENHTKEAQSMGVLVEPGGQDRKYKNLRIQLFHLLGISVVILYLVLLIQFGSFWWPLIVIAVIPPSIGGSLLTLYFTGNSLNILSGIGLIAMLGIVVNDAILKVSAIRKYVQHQPLDKALIRSMQVRLKPILMTTGTTLICGIPVLFFQGTGNELQRSLVLALAGGVCISTFAALYLVPALVVAFQGVLIRHPTGSTFA